MTTANLVRCGVSWVLIAAALCLTGGCQQFETVSQPWLSWKRPEVGTPAKEATALPKLTRQEQKRARFALARSLEQTDELSQAAEAYEALLSADTKHGGAHHRLAVVYDRLGKPLESEPHYRRALELLPNDPELRADFGYSLYSRGKWEEAEQLLQQALAKQPTLARAHNNLGLIQARTGRIEAALHSFQQSGSGPSQAHANVAFALMLDQRWPEAQRQLDVARSIDPTSPLIRQRKDELELIMARHGAAPVAIQPAQYTEPAVSFDTLNMAADSPPAPPVAGHAKYHVNDASP